MRIIHSMMMSISNLEIEYDRVYFFKTEDANLTKHKIYNIIKDGQGNACYESNHINLHLYCIVIEEVAILLEKGEKLPKIIKALYG